MFETTTTQNKTFKEINKLHDTICIEDVNGTKSIQRDDNKIYIEFFVNGINYISDAFDTEKEALKFRDEVMGWNNDK